MKGLEIEVLSISQSSARCLYLTVVVGRADGKKMTKEEIKNFYIRQQLCLTKKGRAWEKADYTDSV